MDSPRTSRSLRGSSGLLLALTLGTSAAADTLAPIVVSPGAENLAARPAPEDATSPVRTIERPEFDNRMISLADIVGEQAGIQVRQSGGLGSLSTVSLRGSSSQQVQVFVDGMLLNDPVTGSVDLSQFSLHDMARVHVYPSSPPAQYAHASIGGVVAMETLEQTDRDSTRAHLGYGSFSTRRAGLFHGASRENLNYWVSLNHQGSDNDFSYSNESEWFNPRDGDTTTRRNAEMRQNDASAKIGYHFDEGRQLDALVQWREQSSGVPTIQNWEDNDASLDTSSNRMQLHYRDPSWFEGRLHSSHRLLWSDAREDFADLAGRVGTGRQDVRTRTQRIGTLNTLSALLGAHTVTTAVDVSLFDYEQEDRIASDPADARERLQVTTALGHEWFSDDGQWQTQAVARHFRLRDDSEETQPDDSVRTRTERDGYTAWQLGARRALGPGWSLTTNIAHQVRIPTLRERFGQQGLFVGNPELTAEEAQTLDATIAAEPDWGEFDVTLFRRDLDPAIVAIFDARGVGRYINTEARVQGVEISAHHAPIDWWVLKGNLTLQDSENIAPGISDRDGRNLPGIYHRSAMLRSTWLLDRYRLSLSYHLDDELFYDAANRQEADARRLVNAALTWRREWSGDRETRVELELRNLTDEVYQDFNRFPGPGRSGFLSLNHSF